MIATILSATLTVAVPLAFAHGHACGGVAALAIGGVRCISQQSGEMLLQTFAWRKTMSGSFSYKSLGDTNLTWGICGFTSSFYAMYKESAKTRAWLINATQAYSVLYEIRDYLMDLKGTNSPYINDINEFTRSFGGKFSNFTIDDFIKEIDKASATEKLGKDILGDQKFSMAMPPDCIGDYLTRFWKAKATVQKITADTGADGIIGVCKDDPAPGGKRMPYNGLVHYMYRRNGIIYSWGRTFMSVNLAAQKGVGLPSWTVRWLISVKSAGQGE